MKKRLSVLITAVTFAVFSSLAVSYAQAGEMALAKASNPCSMKKNPCSMKKNPCSMQKNPCSTKNPCSAASGIVPLRARAIKNKKALKKLAKKLWKDTKLGNSGLACNTCHPDGMGMKKTPYPKYIKMPNDIVTLDQMINFCMLNPMRGKPFAWNSREMTAIASYINSHLKGGSPAQNPCSMKKNPCSMKMNPCSMKKNPCSIKNPCAGK